MSTLLELRQSKLGDYKAPAEEIQSALNYIEEAASRNNIDLSELDLEKSLPGESGVSPVTLDRDHINKTLFENKKAWGVKEYSAELSDEWKMIKKYLDKQKEKIINQTKEQIRGNLIDFQDNTNLAQVNLKYAWQGRLLIDSHEEKGLFDKEFQDRLQSVLKKGFWKHMGIFGNTIVFVTCSDVILTHKNKAAGLDQHFNFGKFAYVFNMESAQSGCYMFRNTHCIDKVIHPFVKNGQICWGNAQNSYIAAAKAFQIDKILDLLSQLLTTYSEAGGPFRTLADFLGFSGVTVRKDSTWFDSDELALLHLCKRKNYPIPKKLKKLEKEYNESVKVDDTDRMQVIANVRPDFNYQVYGATIRPTIQEETQVRF